MEKFGLSILPALLLGAVMAATASQAGASPITYNVTDTAGSLSYTGTITTDGNTGILGKADILDWNLTIHGFGTPEILTPADSVVKFDGTSLLSATPTQLAWIFSGTIGNVQSDFFFQLGPAAFVLDQIIYQQSSGIDSGVFSINAQNAGGGSTQTVDLGTSDVFGTAVLTASVPEPSTWAMMILGFAGLGFMGYRRRKSALA
jgi:hypothetical protein